MVTGRGLDPWGVVPGLRRLTVVGRVLRATPTPGPPTPRCSKTTVLRRAVALGCGPAQRLRRARTARRAPGPRDAPVSREPRGAADGDRRLPRRKPVGAICHGVLVAARAVDPVTERSVLYGRRTTALTWALERKAWGIARYTRFWDSNYYRTYVEEPGQRWGFMSVQQEVTRALADPTDFADVRRARRTGGARPSGRARDTLDDPRPPSSCVTGPTSRRAGPATCTPSPGPSRRAG